MSDKKDESHFDYDQQPAFIDYLKEHSTLLVAGVSAIIAVLSFFVNALSYISLRVSLREYLLLPEMIRENGQGKVFINIVVLLVDCFILFFSIFVIRHFLNQHFVFSSFLKFNIIYKKKSKDDFENNDFPVKDQKLGNKAHLTLTFFKVFACVIIIAITDIILIATDGIPFSFSITLIASSILVSLACALCISLVETQIYRKKEIGKIVDSIISIEDDEQRKKEYIVYYNKYYKISYMPSEYKLKATKMNIVYSFMSSMAAVILAFACIISASTITATNKKVYQLYYDKEKTYAVVYQDSDYYVLDEASIKGNDLLIYINCQRFIVTNDISFEYRAFDNVIKTGKPYNITVENIITEENNTANDNSEEMSE